MSIFLITFFILGLIGYVAGSVGGMFYLTTAPNRKLPPETPASVGLTSYQEIEFPSAEAARLILRGWWIPRPDSRKALILVHVKNGDRTFGLKVARQLWAAGYNLLLFDMRGHGLSDGEHYTYGYHEQRDIVGAVNWLKSQKQPPLHIGVLGWSLGGAASLLAMGATPEIKAGVIDSAYGDLGRVTAARLGFLNILSPGLNLSGKLFLDSELDKIKPEAAFEKMGNRRVLLIHGENDVTVPVSEVYQLRKAGGADVEETWVLPGVGHAAAFEANPSEYLQKVIKFFDRELS